MMLFSGSANPALAAKIAAKLAIPLSPTLIERFPDTETKISINATVRNKHVCIIQPTSSPVNDNIIELCLMTNALRRSGAAHITAVVPYFAYARQDLAATQANSALSAQAVANIFNSMQLDHLITLDLHNSKMSDMFNCKINNLSSLDVFMPELQSKKLYRPVIVAPDIGGSTRAGKLAKALNYELVILVKQRDKTSKTILGNVADRDCIIIDDIIATGSTICHAASALKAQGARKIYAYCTHPVLSGDALEKLYNSNNDEITLTDSIEFNDFNMYNDKLKTLSIAPFLANYLSEAQRKRF